ncbi:uncharacterized protein BDR25DRAFT_261266 [Lindgomyces ingoldianus]|uniref:Uncharacterized protein n=1 Tax=Lindgomyces ingoldianus TaxID=673940 RepID=A0ACB6QVS9_9PLEO|nr:uncharacterized protein BDR25DRAFT_261266 [Lindgomyces ingoldianus]KAF2470966.1 hypothetical protein BDR25DRAFT_261266 [Lindgomyces ingoldianus]
MKYLLASAALAAVALATPVPDAVATAPASFKIARVVYGGSGCPQGSINVDFTDSRLLPIYFGKDFTATAGTGVDAVESRKNCQINLDLQFSPGFQYTVLSADYSGWADLDSGVKGVVRANYYFSGDVTSATTTMGISGPFTGRYTKHDDISVAVWSPCGSEAMLNVNADVSLTPLGGPGSGTLVALKESARFTQSLYIKWRQC